MQLMYLVKRIRGGVADKEFLGEGNIQLVRKIEVRSHLDPYTKIEVYAESRFTQIYKGTISMEKGRPVWESEKQKGWTTVKEKRYINPNGTLGDIVDPNSHPFGL